MTFVLDIPQASTSLESHIDKLAMESSFVANVVDLFRNTLPSLSDKLTEVTDMIKPLDDQEQTLRQIKNNLNTNTAFLKTLPIVKHAQTLVPVPEGFKDHYVPYLAYLVKTLPDAYDQAIDLIQIYRGILSAFISNKENKTGLSDQTIVFKQAAKKRDYVTKGIGDFFDSSSVARRPLSKLYDQGNEFIIAGRLVEELAKVRKNHDLKALHQQSKEIAELMDIVIEQTITKAASDVSGASALNLAEGGLEVARWVELNATLYFRAEQAINLFNAQVEFVANLK